MCAQAQTRIIVYDTYRIIHVQAHDCMMLLVVVACVRTLQLWAGFECVRHSGMVDVACVLYGSSCIYYAAAFGYQGVELC